MVSMKNMLDAGVHFGHQTARWNPKMKPYVFSNQGGIHIIDLEKTMVMTKKAMTAIKEGASEGEEMIFVGTKKQAVEAIKEAAEKTRQYYVVKRWLGGTLTNFTTIKQSIDRLRKVDLTREKGDFAYFSKKEQIRIEKEYSKLNEYLKGIRHMKRIPNMIFIVDIVREHIAVKEANKLGLKVFGLCDTNSDPETINYPMAGNDDAIRSIQLFCNLACQAYLEGAEIWQQKLREETDKEVKEEKKHVKPQTPQVKPSSGGPEVIRATRGRKLVAAGTADEIEILHEVAQEEEKQKSESESGLKEEKEV